MTASVILPRLAKLSEFAVFPPPSAPPKLASREWAALL